MSDAHLNINHKPVTDQNPIPVKIVSGQPGSSGAGDASAQKQDEQLQKLVDLTTALGDLTTAAAPADGGGNYGIIAALKRSLLNSAAVLGRMPALVSGRVPVNSSVPTASTVTILALSTAATGSSYTAFATQACSALDIVNNTGVTVEYRRGASGVAMQIPTGSARMVIGITNADQIQVRRTDSSNTPATLQAEAIGA